MQLFFGTHRWQFCTKKARNVTFVLFMKSRTNLNFDCFQNIISACQPSSIEPYTKDASCGGPFLTSVVDFKYKIISRNGYCSYKENCSVGTTIMLDVESWYWVYVGSIYLTCTEHGWFPPKPKHDSCRRNR